MAKISKWIKSKARGTLGKDDNNNNADTTAASASYMIRPGKNEEVIPSSNSGNGYYTSMESSSAQQQQQQQPSQSAATSPTSTKSKSTTIVTDLSPTSASSNNITTDASEEIVSNQTSESGAQTEITGSTSDGDDDDEHAKNLVISHPGSRGGNNVRSTKSNLSGKATKDRNNKSTTTSRKSRDPTEDMSRSMSGSTVDNDRDGGDDMTGAPPQQGYNDEDYGGNHAANNYHGHLNSLFNGHLMKWKYESEEGTAFVRIPAFFGGLGLIATNVAALVLYPDSWTISAFVITAFVFVIAFTICILDGRFLASSPLSWRAHLRNVITRHFNIFRFLWGRALLYLAAGLLSCALLETITIIAGVVMLVIGFIALMVGTYASRKFSSLRNSLADESFLLLEFSNYDYDDDGYLSATEFSHLLNTLGMELDDRYSLKAFNAIDMDHDRKISFEEFSQWWSQGYIERGRKGGGGYSSMGGKSTDDDDDEEYQRLD